jgi:hypothetical protein
MRWREANPIAQCQIAVVGWKEHGNLRGGLLEKFPALQISRKDDGANSRLVDAGVPSSRLDARLGAPVLVRDPCGSSDVISRYDEPLGRLCGGLSGGN